MPYQPHATNARNTAGTRAPMVPNDARASTADDDAFCEIDDDPRRTVGDLPIRRCGESDGVSLDFGRDIALHKDAGPDVA